MQTPLWPSPLPDRSIGPVPWSQQMRFLELKSFLWSIQVQLGENQMIKKQRLIAPHSKIHQSWKKKYRVPATWLHDFSHHSYWMWKTLYTHTPMDSTRAEIKAPDQEPRWMHTQDIDAYTEPLGNSPSLILYFIKNSSCATHCTLTPYSTHETERFRLVENSRQHLA